MAIDAADKAKIGRRMIGAAALVSGMFLIFLAAPRTWTGLGTVGARSVLQDVRAGQPATKAALAEAAGSLARALSIVKDGQMAADRGFLLLQQEEAAQQDPALRARLSGQALEATEEGLAESPLQSAVWARLAWLRKQRGDNSGALAALRLSFLTGAVVPPLMASRLSLALSLLPQTDSELRALIDRQIRLLWVSDPDRLVAYANHPDWGPAVRNALAGMSGDEAVRLVRRDVH